MPSSVDAGSVVLRVEPGETAELSTEDLLLALPDCLGPMPRSRAFRIRLAFCAATLLALLMVYVTLVMVASYGLWSHLASPGVVAAAHRLVPSPPLFIFLCVAGVILCVFLVKPLFTLRASRPPSVRLERSAEPRLFAFVDRLCAAQGAPAPSEILVDTQVNASASLRHNLVGLFRDDLTLTIGLPLARGMSLREFAGVLAHEFGHFAQGGAMRLSTLVRRSLSFMLRIVHERDGFDAILHDAGRVRLFLDPRLLLLSVAFSVFIWAVLAVVWLARMLLKGLAWVGMASAGALLREMEYDADLHEARVVGRETFVETGTRLLVLDAARGAAGTIEQRSWGTQRLPEDMPGLIAILAERIGAQPDAVRDLREGALNATTKRFDSHPCLRDREAAVRREADAGTFRLDAPASTLFSDLTALSREATLATYRELLGMEFKATRFLPVAEILYEIEGDTTVTQRLARLTRGCPPDACRVAIGPMQGAATPGEPPPREPSVQDLDVARRRILELAPKAIEAAARLDEARQRLDRYRVVTALRQTGFPVDPGPIGEDEAPGDAVAEGRKRAARDIQDAERDLIPFSEAVNDRLRIALRRRPAAGAAGPCCAGTPAPEAMVATLEAFNSARTHAEILRSRLAVLLGILLEAQRVRGNPLVVRPAYDACADVKAAVGSFRAVIDGIPYPFHLPMPEAFRGAATPTVGVFLGHVSLDSDPGVVYSQGSDLASRLRRLEERLLSSLAQVTEQVEHALGLSPLPDPPPEVTERSPA
jgi:Zn-dependent protease with chaperone function